MRITPFACFHKKGPQDGHEDTGTGKNQRQQNPGQTVELIGKATGHEGGTQDHGPHNGTHIRFKKVGSHTGHITDIIPDIVGNGCRVQRMILRDSGFDFTHQVGTNVGCLGIDTTTNAGKEGNRRSTKRKTGDHRNDFIHRSLVTYPELTCKKDKTQAQAQNPQADNTHSHDRTAREGNFKGFGQSGTGSIGCPYIGFGGYLHSDKTGQARTQRTHHEGKANQR